ncbi:MAG: SHOCT domain-containing protein [Chloroflexi bacterium]|nr:SHOCT domain-containing protein [Chloroflexota bacterium]
MMHGFPGMWFGFGPLFSFIFFLAMIFLIAGVAKAVFPGRWSTSSASASPLDILKTRYAKGKITREEFQRMKEEIS